MLNCFHFSAVLLFFSPVLLPLPSLSEPWWHFVTSALSTLLHFIHYYFLFSAVYENINCVWWQLPSQPEAKEHLPSPPWPLTQNSILRTLLLSSFYERGSREIAAEPKLAVAPRKQSIMSQVSDKTLENCFMTLYNQWVNKAAYTQRAKVTSLSAGVTAHGFNAYAVKIGTQVYCMIWYKVRLHLSDVCEFSSSLWT